MKDASAGRLVGVLARHAFLIIVCISAITALGTNANSTFSTVSTTIGGTSS